MFVLNKNHNLVVEIKIHSPIAMAYAQRFERR